MGRVDTLDDIHTPDEFAKMLELQRKAEDARFVILSDVHLDDPDVLANLQLVCFVACLHCMHSVYFLLCALLHVISVCVARSVRLPSFVCKRLFLVGIWHGSR